MNKTSFGNLYGTTGTTFPDNTTAEISEGDMRGFGEAIKSSVMFIDDNFIDEDNMSSDSATKAPSQQSVKAYSDRLVKATDAQVAGNVGTGEDSLWQYAGSGLYLANNGDSIHAIIHGSYSANANNKRIRVNFDISGSPELLFDSGNIVANDGVWTVEIEIYRTGANEQKCKVQFSYGTVSGSSYSMSPRASGVITTTHPSSGDGTMALGITGEATSNNDIVKQIAKVTFAPGVNFQS